MIAIRGNESSHEVTSEVFTVYFDDTTTLALSYPKGGDTLSMGDTVSISFRANGDSIAGIKIQVTSNNGKRPQFMHG